MKSYTFQNFREISGVFLIASSRTQFFEKVQNQSTFNVTYGVVKPLAQSSGDFPGLSPQRVRCTTLLHCVLSAMLAANKIVHSLLFIYDSCLGKEFRAYFAQDDNGGG